MMIPYDNIDPEIRPLIKALNNTSCIVTVGCCIGHSLDPISSVIFYVVDEMEWRKCMLDILRLNSEIREANIEIYQWYRMGDNDRCLVDWKIELQVHPRNSEISEPEEQRIARIKQGVISKIVELIA